MSMINLHFGQVGRIKSPRIPAGNRRHVWGAKILELMARSGKRLGEFQGEWLELKVVKTKVRCLCGEKGQGMRELLQFGTGSRRELIDGARVSEEGG